MSRASCAYGHLLIVGLARLAIVSATAFGLASCFPSPETSADSGPEYATTSGTPQKASLRFAVHPLQNPAKLYRHYQPLIDYLNVRISGTQLVLEASRDYAEYERKIEARAPEFILPNPWQSLQAMRKGYSVIAMAGSPEDFKGIILTRRDSSIREVGDLRGKSVAYPSPTALAACIMPQWFLHTQGLDVVREIENRYVGSQESAIMNVYLGETAAGVTWIPPWRAFVKEHPQEAEALHVLWETPPLVNNSVMVRADIPVTLRDEVRRLLTDLHQTPEGRAVLEKLEAARFLPATDADYEPVRQFVDRFETHVRPVGRK